MKKSFRKRLRLSLRGCRPRPSFRLCLFEEEFCMDAFGFLIPLPFMDQFMRQPYEMMESWGPYYFERSVWWTWGTYSRSWRMPWSMEHINHKHQVMIEDGSWETFVADYDGGDRSRDWKQVVSYRYKLRNGEVQSATATITVGRREWRWLWLKWLPLFAKRRQYIEVEFNSEIGERAGSWKGGAIGCSYDMKDGETPYQALRRMESERKFE